MSSNIGARPPVTVSEPALGRRALLRAGALTAPGLLIGSPAAAEAAATAKFNPANWESVRAQFSLTRDYAHFSAFMLASNPMSVRKAIARLRDGLDTFPEQFHMGAADLDYSERARAAVARYVGGSPAEVALTDSATMGIGLVYRGLRLEPGDEVITTPHDFYSTYESLRLRAVADGIVVRDVPLYEDPARASADDMAARIERAMSDRTRVVAITWVHSSTGVKIPIRQIADVVARVNAHRDQRARILLCVDGVHGFAAEDVAVADLGADFFMTATHKWLFGPRGTGFVWGKESAWARHETVLPSFSIPAFIGWLTGRAPQGDPGMLNTPGGYHSFENRWALPDAIEFHEAVGRSRIAQRIRTQAAQLKQELSSLPHIRLVTPLSSDVSSGIVCCAVDGMSADEVVGRLFTEQRIAAGATPYRESFVRFGPSIVTSPGDVERLVAAMARFR